LATPDEVYNYPANVFVADFVGSPPMNILPAVRQDGEIVVPGGWRIPTAARNGFPADLKLGVRPEAIEIVPQDTPGAALAQVVISEPLGSEVIVNVMFGETMIRVRTAPEIRPRPDETVYLLPQRDAIRLFDSESGAYLPP
jgi:multiple sugar transport system ATP-binding protein